MVRGRVVDPRGATRARLRLRELSAPAVEPGPGESEEDEAEDGSGVLLGGEAAVGAKLVGGEPEALLEYARVGVLRGGRSTS